ncbi:Tfp pilus assembly protein, tip-associated adhesin PilY1 [Variovorax sp. SRS16]|uniref:pilus assembly protein n=1 Tax=Variovorax sp. SRS16 TaxID=282217 RepID=UPI0013163B9A|nr:PilC/PilY family type IV pilus protein [Variovorax sp. SRS16]VTU33999.1 Tfp pilus assembly protein, tip-associated adhesin PilY1 [Variovorax sp. SRS16]
MKNKAIAAFALEPHGRAARCARLSLLVCALTIAAFAPAAKAGLTDLSNQPLATRPTVQAKPNLLFILDSSGSMNWSYMPDDLGQSQNTSDQPYTNWYGYWSAQCNGVAYDPTTTYNPPLNADGTSFPNANFSAAKADGFNASSSTTNLANSYYYRYSGSQPKMGWTYTASGVISNTFFTECSTRTSVPSSIFTKWVMTSSSSDAQNYANWYSYYSHRYLLMRTAMGRAISALDANYRVGFTTIYDTAAVDGTNYFRDVKDFDATQKANFYSSLYGVAPNGSTPLPTALAEAGLYFAKKIPRQQYDPMQYSCQRNYALLSTDGYWNSNNSVRLDGRTAIGQQDGTEDRPMRDDTRSIVTTVTPWTAPATRNQTSSKQSRTITWTRTTVSSSGPGTKSNGGTSKNSCTKTGYYLVSTKTQTATEKQTQQFFTPQSGTSQYNVTTVTTDGTLTSTNQSTAAVPAWSSGNTTVVITDTSTTTNPTTTDPIDPPAASYNAGSSTNTACQTAPVSSGPTDAITNTGNWSPSTLTYTTDSPVIGTYTAGTSTSTPSTSGGSPNTLADVAEYYYKNDLRNSALGNCTSTSSGSSQDVCADIVRPVGTDLNTMQHMNTFTIGLGASGTLPYDRNYLTQTVGAFADLKSGAVNWPTPNPNGDATNIDDLWHAAVNGRGQYYSALNASLLADAINGVITTVQQVAGSASAASTSSLELVAGNNNQVYRASYTTGTWTGDLQAFTLNAADASIAATPSWSAQTILDTTPATSRKIYFSGASGLQSFTYSNLSAAQQAYFDNFCSQAAVATQCATLTTADKTLANTGANLINYLSGVRSYETAVATASTGISTTSSALYRARDHVLGDIINGAPVHVGKPPFTYGDAGYADFVTAQSLRKNVVYVAANDGMLHAFSADPSDGGTELWAYVPTAVMPNLYKLADASYASKHQYYVDGAPVMADIQVGTTWKTILVGGLNDGGSSYYALDITDPSNPKALWEFTDANLGLSFGNPVVTKRADGTWVVAFASGYNNTSGDGQGHLYVLNANSGTKLLDISTGVGSSTDPSGLAKINTWIDNPADNTGKRFYGGDLKGNLWRFDVDKLVAPNQAAMQLAKFQINTTTPQPITTKPELAQVSGKPVVLVATGRYLGVSDITDMTQQSIYAIKDPLTATGWGDVRADTADFVQQTFTVDNTTTPPSASVTNLTVDWTTKAGWWVDLPHAGERVNTNLTLQFNTLAIATAIPNGDACASGGSSWRYYLDVTNGGVITTNPTGEQWSSNSLIVGLTWVKDSNGNIRIITQGSNGDLKPDTPPIPPITGSGSAHRTSWRELSD